MYIMNIHKVDDYKTIRTMFRISVMRPSDTCPSLLILPLLSFHRFAISLGLEQDQTAHKTAPQSLPPLCNAKIGNFNF